MSLENVEFVRTAFEAWYPNDSQMFAACLDPKFEYHVTYGVEQGIYRGWEATVEAFDRWQDVFSDYRWVPTDYVDAGDEHVIVPFTEHGLGQTSGIQVGQQPAFLCVVRNHRIQRITEYQSTAEARQAAGLAEDLVSQEGIEITPATPHRRKALAALFGRAFVNEPMMRWPMGEHGDVAERFTLAFDCFLRDVLGLGLVSEAPSGRGAAVWIPPVTFSGWRRSPWNQSRIRSLTDDGGDRYDAFWTWIDAQRPSEMLWQLDSIAVEPRFQRRGIGGALIAYGLAKARSDGVGVFLSTGTPRNVSIYARSGFTVAKEANAPGGGPPIWFMRWDP